MTANDEEKTISSQPPELKKDARGNVQFSFSSQHMERWNELGLIPKHLVDNLHNEAARLNDVSKKLKEAKEKNPDMSTEGLINQVFDLPRVLTPEESEQLLNEGRLQGEFHNFLIQNWEQLEQAVTEPPLAPLFKNVDPVNEFGVVRFIADQMNHLPDLLANARVERVGKNEYVIIARKNLQDELKTLTFNHPMTAQSQESAEIIAESIKEKLLGLRTKMWLACWLYANEIKKIQFSVPIIDLMKACYPERKSQFSAKEKEKFYEELRLLRLAEFTLSGKYLRKNGKSTDYKYNIPLLRVSGAIGEDGTTNGPPHKVLIELCAITPLPPQKEKMRFVAAPMKKKTLELIDHDCGLAFFLQLRKNQLSSGDDEKLKAVPFHDFAIEQLISEASLTGTFSSNPRVARQRLLEKLSRAKEKKIVSNFSRIENFIRVWW